MFTKKCAETTQKKTVTHGQTEDNKISDEKKRKKKDQKNKL